MFLRMSRINSLHLCLCMCNVASWSAKRAVHRTGESSPGHGKASWVQRPEALWLSCQVHTHTQSFNGPFSGTTRVSRYEKGKTNLDFTEARDSEWQWHQLGHMQVCTSLQTDNHATPHNSVFYRPDALPAAQPTASKHRRLSCQVIIVLLLKMVALVCCNL